MNLSQITPERSAKVKISDFEFSVTFSSPRHVDTVAPDGTALDTHEVLRRILKKIEGLTFDDGSTIDPTNKDHFDLLPLEVSAAIFSAILEAVTPKKPN